MVVHRLWNRGVTTLLEKNLSPESPAQWLIWLFNNLFDLFIYIGHNHSVT